MAQIAPLILVFALICGYGQVIALAVYSLVRGPAGWRRRGILLVPAIAAIALLVSLVALFPAHSLNAAMRLLSGGFAAAQIHLSLLASWGVALLAVVTGFVAVYFSAHAIPLGLASLGRSRDDRSRGRIADIARALLILVVAIATLGGSFAAQSVAAGIPQEAAAGRILFEHQLPGSPTGITLDGSGGYITLGEGRVLRFEMSEGGAKVDFTEVASGLTFPRGPAVAEGELLVSDLGTLGCAEPFPQCWTADPQEELQRINASSAKVVAYPIAADGSLGSPRDVLTNLPVVNTEHAPNSITLGPDGYLYMPIGGVDRLPFASDPPFVSHPNAKLLGTIVRFTPNDTQPEIVATGIRNIYALAFSPDGRMLGSENDGQAIRGWRHEQILDIQAGQDYGYPQDGTFGPGVPPPVWIVAEAGTAGLTWADVGDASGVLVGALGTIIFVPLEQDDRGLFVKNEQDVQSVVSGLGGFVTAIVPLTGDTYAATIFDPTEARNSLIVLHVTGAAQ